MTPPYPRNQSFLAYLIAAGLWAAILFLLFFPVQWWGAR
jgi:hypothetical protein